MTDKSNQDVELNDDENEVVEAHDPKNAEEASVASVKKAENAGKTAPARKGDKKNSEKSDLKAVAKEDVDFSEDLEALIAEEATLSEGFKGKAAIIFEAAFNSKLSQEVSRLEEQYETRIQEETNQIKDELVEKVDGYLNYVVENWMEENKVAIHNGLRTEIAEEFMGKLKDLFTESYIEVPESKVDLVDELAEQVAALEGEVNAHTSKMIEMTEQLEQYKRYEIVREHASGLADTEVEKLVKLAADVEFVSEEKFSEKVATIKEAYFKKKTTAETVNESLESEPVEEEVEVSSSMSAYLQAIRKSQK
jgi:uncharacterized protein YukE